MAPGATCAGPAGLGEAGVAANPVATGAAGALCACALVLEKPSSAPAKATLVAQRMRQFHAYLMALRADAVGDMVKKENAGD